jgi:3-dehydroquinate dehydratase/shikimate dehydrogenase
VPTAPLDSVELNARYVFDLVYNPIETPLLRLARQKGIAVISGVEMFVQQGARQFEIWTGKPAPEEEMLRVVLHSLRQGAEAAPVLDPAPAQPESRAVAPVKPVPEPAAKTPSKPARAKVAPRKLQPSARKAAPTKKKVPARPVRKPIAAKSSKKPVARAHARRAAVASRSR